MTKVNFGLFFLIIVLLILIFLHIQMDKNFVYLRDQLEVINSKLDHLDYDLHELEEK